jgi:hypothetical protein
MTIDASIGTERRVGDDATVDEHGVLRDQPLGVVESWVCLRKQSVRPAQVALAAHGLPPSGDACMDRRPEEDHGRISIPMPI